jgi:hypothetical protein
VSLTTCRFCASSCSPGNGRFCCGICAQFPLENRFIGRHFSREILNVFQGTGIEPQSMTCANDVRAAREKNDVSTGTSGTEIKGRPRQIVNPSKSPGHRHPHIVIRTQFLIVHGVHAVLMAEVLVGFLNMNDRYREMHRAIGAAVGPIRVTHESGMLVRQTCYLRLAIHL